MTIVDEPDDFKAAQHAILLASTGKADALMKGFLHTSAFLKANFHKKCGLVAPGSLVNQVTLTEFPAQNRLVLLSDCAINVSPSIKKRCRSYRMQSPWLLGSEWNALTWPALRR
ncbi:hypothetical protein FYJ37_16725 [[Clostridium] scindens]|uniref:Phosphate acetyl/butaryl transferase domain-containing protein n=2 Tax=Clostridium scindens (strain JCM 10418 / VPI 12708) TaxID=29347 RepID=A0A844FDQ0_CLOSV|nr:hypothetical protein [Lachnospiraceae bacterium]MSS41904.1 hypothetical protein [[Clostridium] scindens]